MGSGLYRLWLFGTDLRRMDEGDHERTVPRPVATVASLHLFIFSRTACMLDVPHLPAGNEERDDDETRLHLVSG